MRLRDIIKENPNKTGGVLSTIAAVGMTTAGTLYMMSDAELSNQTAILHYVGAACFYLTAGFNFWRGD